MLFYYESLMSLRNKLKNGEWWCHLIYVCASWGGKQFFKILRQDTSVRIRATKSAKTFIVII